MKKSLVVILMCLGVILLVSIGVVADKYVGVTYEEWLDFISSTKNQEEEEIVVEVNGEKIYRSSIDSLVLSKQIIAENAQQLNNSETETFDEEAAEKEVIEEQIRDIVVFQKAEELGLTVSYEEAYVEAVDAYTLAKELNEEQVAIKYMEAMDMTEEEYLEQIGKVYQKMLTRAKLYEKFAEGREESYDVVASEYEEYIQELISEADIVFK